MLNIVIVFGGYVGYQVLDGDARIGLALAFQLLEPLVVGGNVETVEDGPVQVDTCIESLVKHSVVLGCLSGGSGFGLGIVYGSLVAGGEVQCGQVARIAQCGVVLADLLFIADNAQGVVVQQSLLQTGLQGVGRRRLCIKAQRCAGSGYEN